MQLVWLFRTSTSVSFCIDCPHVRTMHVTQIEGTASREASRHLSNSNNCKNSIVLVLSTKQQCPSMCGLQQLFSCCHTMVCWASKRRRKKSQCEAHLVLVQITALENSHPPHPHQKLKSKYSFEASAVHSDCQKSQRLVGFKQVTTQQAILPDIGTRQHFTTKTQIGWTCKFEIGIWPHETGLWLWSTRLRKCSHAHGTIRPRNHLTSPS